MIDLATAASSISANGADVLCIDSCALLHLISAPARTLGADHVSAALNLLSRAEAQPIGLNIVITKEIVEEIARNRENVKTEAVTFFRKHDNVNKNVAALINTMTLGSASASEFGRAGYVEAASDTVDRFLSTPLVVNDAPCIDPAIVRLREAKAPAKRGKDSFADCLIIETFIRLVSDLREAGFRGKAIFLTTNRSDFADVSTNLVHPDLATDFSRVSADLSLSFLNARYALFPP